MDKFTNREDYRVMREYEKAHREYYENRKKQREAEFASNKTYLQYKKNNEIRAKKEKRMHLKKKFGHVIGAFMKIFHRKKKEPQTYNYEPDDVFQEENEFTPRTTPQPKRTFKRKQHVEPQPPLRRSGRSHFLKKYTHHHRKLILAGIIVACILGVVWAHHAYNKAQDTFSQTYQTGTSMRNTSSLLKHNRPFSVLLLGTDTGALGRHDKGRTDTIIVATVNAQKKKIDLTSIPRDTKVNIPEANDPTQKINAAYTVGGPKCAIKTVQKLLNVPIDFYVLLNMKGLEKMVNSVGGVTVDPPLSFHYEAAHVKKNTPKHLEGKAALDYSRMRHQDPQGDFGRQARQREVLQKLLIKGMKISSLPHYKRILNSLKGNMKTDMTFNDMLRVRARYGDATHNLDSFGLKEQGDVDNGVDYEVPSKKQINYVSRILRRNLDLKAGQDDISDRDIITGEGNDDSDSSDDNSDSDSNSSSDSKSSSDDSSSSSSKGSSSSSNTSDSSQHTEHTDSSK